MKPGLTATLYITETTFIYYRYTESIVTSTTVFETVMTTADITVYTTTTTSPTGPATVTTVDGGGLNKFFNIAQMYANKAPGSLKLASRSILSAFLYASMAALFTLLVTSMYYLLGYGFGYWKKRIIHTVIAVLVIFYLPVILDWLLNH